MKSKGEKNGNGIADLRALFRTATEARNAAAVATAQADLAAATFNASLAQELASRNASQGWGIDLADGALKPANEIPPYKPV